jgi:hypothetical protein
VIEAGGGVRGRKREGESGTKRPQCVCVCVCVDIGEGSGRGSQGPKRPPLFSCRRSCSFFVCAMPQPPSPHLSRKKNQKRQNAKVIVLVLVRFGFS